MPIIGVLLPNVSSVEEYNQISEQISQTSIGSLELINDDMSDEDFENTMMQANASLIYRQFSIFAMQQKRAMYMTWDELRCELKSLSRLDDTIKYLLQKGLLKEGYIEIGEDEKM